jgi:hypothetical protein
MRTRKERRYLTKVKVGKRIRHFIENQWELLLEPHSLHKKSPFRSVKTHRVDDFNIEQEMNEL